MSKKIFIAVAWPYVNGDIHIGHLVGYFIPSDIFARYSRLKGNETLMVSGADCHGTPITIEADKRNITAQELVEIYVPKLQDLIKLYDFSYDLFTKTTTENHKNVTQKVFLDLLRNGYIFKKKSLQYFSEQDHKFLPDRYVEGECPYCHTKEQRADQCENCGRTIGLGELINAYSKLTKSEVTLKETEHFFIELPKLQDEVKSYVLNHESLWKEWVWKETIGFLDEGLQSRAITRDLDWGIKIPNDQLSKEMILDNSESKRFYVWFDAVIGYLSAAIEWSENPYLNISNNKEKWKEFWQDTQTKHYYFMGQDNLTFHTLFWPAQLIGTRQNYNLPYFPSIVKFLNANGAKLSKSRNNIIDAKKIGEVFTTDLVRFYLVSILPENKESNWDWNEFKNTINSQLVGNIGNFIHRTLSFYKNKINNELTVKHTLNTEVKIKIIQTFNNVDKLLEKCSFVNSLEEIKKLSTYGNQYFDYSKPWEILKSDKIRTEEIMLNCLAIVFALKTLLTPFLPSGIKKLNDSLGLINLLNVIDKNNFVFDESVLFNIKVNSNLEPLFKKIEQEDIDKFIESN